LFCLGLLSPAATRLLLLVYCPTRTTLTAFLWRDITRLPQALAALWFVAPGASVIAWCLVVAFSLLAMRNRLLLEFLLVAALLVLLLLQGSAFATLAALLLGIACGFVVVSALVHRGSVHRWTFCGLLLLQGSAFAALTALLLSIRRGFVIFSALVCRRSVHRWTFGRLFLS
jgi:hypothetical protein